MMVLSLNNKRSLTFYQPTSVNSRTKISSSYSGGIAAPTITNESYITATNTSRFNNELNGHLTRLNSLRLSDNVGLNLSTSNYKARNAGVKRAWEYERADIMMGGKGSADWNAEQRQQIMDSNKVRGAEGHHQQNVAKHLEKQADPDNIKFYKSRGEHLRDGHNGNWRNESNGPEINKDRMLKRTNEKRVIRNEMHGIGIAISIGLGIGFAIGFVISLAQSGVTPESIKLAFIEGGKSGIESGVMAGVGYGIGRTIGEVTTKAMAGLLNNLGVNVTENITKMCNMGTVGVLTIVVFSAYQFVKLKHSGVATHETLLIVGRQALFSLTLLAVSIAAQGIWGGVAGIVVSIGIGIIIITYSVVDILSKKEFSQKVRVYMIEKCKPIY